MSRFLYTFTLRLLSPFLIIWMAWRARRAGGQWQVVSAERFGFYRNSPVPARSNTQKLVWVHAVSLGEVRAVQPFVQALLAANYAVLFTHITATGRTEGRRLFKTAIEKGQLFQQWLPYDFPGAGKRFLRHYQPWVGILMEREVWPNLIASARRLHIPMLLVSARFSDQSLRQTLRLGGVMRNAYASLHTVYAQTLSDAQRLEQAGAITPRVSGNFKFDVAIPVPQLASGKSFAQCMGRPVIAIASTREGEDAMFIQALLKIRQRLAAQGKHLHEVCLICLIPRHPQRFDEAAYLLEQAELSFVRRSELLHLRESCAAMARECENVEVLLGDTLGEMSYYYAASSLTIVGGSFAPLGGQNFIEASAIATPVIVGPHTRNFDQAVLDAIDQGAVIRAQHAEAALFEAMRLLEEPQRLARMGAAGEQWVKKHTGAVARVMASLNNME